MTHRSACGRCYLAEWYWPDVTAGWLDDVAARLDERAVGMREEGLLIVRIMTVAIPVDEVAFGLFSAASAAIVADLCRRASIPPTRVSAAIEAS